MLRTVTERPSLWEAILPEELRRLPAELARIDELLDDPAFFTPFVAFFDPRMGRPSTPMETYVRMMFLKFREPGNPGPARHQPHLLKAGPSSDCAPALAWQRSISEPAFRHRTNGHHWPPLSQPATAGSAVPSRPSGGANIAMSELSPKWTLPGRKAARLPPSGDDGALCGGWRHERPC